MTETSTTCLRHPKVQTNLRCASCGELICPRCLVQTPVGAKCRKCATSRRGDLSKLSPVRVTGAIGAGLAAGAIAGWGVEFSLGFFLTFFVAFAYGGFAGEMILRACGLRRGTTVEIIAGVSMAAGALLGRLIVAATLLASPAHVPPMGLFDVVIDLVLPSPVPIIALGIVVASAISRIRYV